MSAIKPITISDHFGGFSKDFSNNTLDQLKDSSSLINCEYIVDQRILSKYPNFRFRFDSNLWMNGNKITDLLKFKTAHNKKDIQNFICSFNGSDDVARQFLTSALYKFKWFDDNFCTKNFITFKDRVDGNLAQYFDNQSEEQFYRKFILHDNDELFGKVISCNYHKFDHLANIGILEDKINKSFIQLIGETLGVSYYPFVTEKIFYPIMCNTFWLAFAQPGYHKFVEQHFGIKRYNKIFDYRFDDIENPVVRLVELLTMLSKFQNLSTLDWDDLYNIESDTIYYNYDFVHSGKFKKKIAKL